MCFVYASFDLHRVMKLDILYCFLFSLDILVHDFEHVFLQLIQLTPKHIIYSTVCLVSGDLKLVIALYLYHGVNASGFQQFIGCLNLFLFLIAANLQSLLCFVIWKPAVGVCSLCLPHVGILITAFSASLFTIQLAVIWVI